MVTSRPWISAGAKSNRASEEMKLAENTIVIGDRGLWQKFVLYEPCR